MTGLLRDYLRRYQGRLVVVLVLLLIQAIGNLLLPSLNADIINNGVLLGDTGYIARVGGTMLAVTLLLGGCAIVGVYYSAQIAMGFGRDVRAAMFRNVQGFSLREVNQFGAPSLITRNTNDVQQVQMLVLMGLNLMITAPITVAGGVIMALRENVKLSGLLLVIVPIMVAVIGLVMSRAIPLFRSVQVKIDAINRVLRENLAGIRVIRAFVRTEFEEERFAAANHDLTDTTLKVTRLFALTMPALMVIINASTIAIVWFGGHLVDSDEMPIGNLTAFISYIMQILFSVLMAVMMFVMVPRAAASAERITDVLAVHPAIHDPDASGAGPAPNGTDLNRTDLNGAAAATQTPSATRGLVEMRDVEFRYPGAQEPVLRDITLTIRPGEMTAIVGSTGSGKTTLVNLIPRLYDVTGGTVLVDGVDVREQPQERLWSGLGIVPQRAFLFSGTIESNLRFGKEEALDDELWQALEVAQAKDFVEELADGLQSRVDQAGANFSGGQRQRLAIARALVRRPAVYIFDDSFSALDYGTDARLRAALVPQTRESAVIVVAQRVSTILEADHIVVLDGGQVVGEGRHDELLEHCETYREIVESQLAAAGAA